MNQDLSYEFTALGVTVSGIRRSIDRHSKKKIAIVEKGMKLRAHCDSLRAELI